MCVWAGPGLRRALRGAKRISTGDVAAFIMGQKPDTPLPQTARGWSRSYQGREEDLSKRERKKRPWRPNRAWNLLLIVSFKLGVCGSFFFIFRHGVDRNGTVSNASALVEDGWETRGLRRVLPTQTLPFCGRGGVMWRVAGWLVRSVAGVVRAVPQENNVPLVSLPLGTTEQTYK